MKGSENLSIALSSGNYIENVFYFLGLQVLQDISDRLLT